jgi:hypothetical protein
VGPYTLLQLFETAVFTVVAIFGVLAHHPSVAVLGIGLLVGKAMMNILPRRHSVMARSLAGYGVGLTLATVAVVAIRRLIP